MVFSKIDKDLMRFVSTPMGDSIAYNPQVKAGGKAKAKAKSKPKTDRPAPKRAKKSGAGAGQSESSIHVPKESLERTVLGDKIELPDGDHPDHPDEEECEDDESPSPSSDAAAFQTMCMAHIFPDCEAAPASAKKREKTFLDDLLQVFNHAVHSQKHWLGSDRTLEKPLMQVRAIIMSLGLEFCFAGSVEVNKKQYKTWSTLRVELRELIVSCLKKMKEAIDSDSASVSAAVSETVQSKGVASMGPTSHRPWFALNWVRSDLNRVTVSPITIFTNQMYRIGSSYPITVSVDY